MGGARYRLPDGLGGLRTSQMKSAIEEANLSQEDREIAKLRYLEHYAQIDIAVEMNYGRTTVYRRLKEITPRISNAARNLPQ